MVVTRKNDEAVSPVIGVILMVAITVILAAVIAAFVFGMSGNITKTRVISTSATQSGSNIMITYQGGQDDPTVQWINVTVGNLAPNTTITTTGGVFPTNINSGVATGAKPGVGSTYNLIGAGTPGQDKIVVVGHFSDGTEQVILDSMV